MLGNHAPLTPPPLTILSNDGLVAVSVYAYRGYSNIRPPSPHGGFWADRHRLTAGSSGVVDLTFELQLHLNI